MLGVRLFRFPVLSSAMNNASPVMQPVRTLVPLLSPAIANHYSSSHSLRYQ